MPLPEPVPGLVIRYDYLWRHEAKQGRIEASKYRPSVVVLSVTGKGTDKKVVWVAPITRRRPHDASAAIEIPNQVKQRLGLDAKKSWIIISEVNRFIWPGPDICPISQGQWAYGVLPHRLFQAILDRLKIYRDQRKTKQVQRD